MTSKSEVNKILKGVVNDRFAELWWDLRIPAFGMDSPNQVWDKDPERVLEYVKGYQDSTFS